MSPVFYVVCTRPFIVHSQRTPAGVNENNETSQAEVSITALVNWDIWRERREEDKGERNVRGRVRDQQSFCFRS